MLKGIKTKFRNLLRHYKREIRSWHNLTFNRERIVSKVDGEHALPRTLYIECTNICNAKCIFCYYRIAAKDLAFKVMPVHEFRRIAEEFSQLGGDSISLTPTMADPLTDKYLPDRIQVLDTLRYKRVSFYTNLINFTNKIQRALAGAENIELHVNVSFTGFDRDAYKKFMGVDRFIEVKRNLKRFASIINPRLHKKVVLRDYIGSGTSRRKLVEYLNEIKIDYEIIDNEFDTWGGLVAEDLSQVEELNTRRLVARRGPCMISYTKPLVTVDLKLKLCECRDAKDELIVGDLQAQSLEEIWASEKTKKIRSSMYDPEKMPDICKKCEVYVSIFENKIRTG
jgi:radical SAM protein with 4Fe4S-binding SPASM domain